MWNKKERDGRPWMPRGRPKSPGISQTYNSGVINLFTVTDTAPAGYAPQISKAKKEHLMFAERTCGVARYTEAMQEGYTLSRLVRTPLRESVTTRDIAEIQNIEYHIRRIQRITEVYPPSMDLSLERVEQAEETEEAEEARCHDGDGEHNRGVDFCDR